MNDVRVRVYVWTNDGQSFFFVCTGNHGTYSKLCTKYIVRATSMRDDMRKRKEKNRRKTELGQMFETTESKTPTKSIIKTAFVYYMCKEKQSEAFLAGVELL